MKKTIFYILITVLSLNAAAQFSIKARYSYNPDKSTPGDTTFSKLALVKIPQSFSVTSGNMGNQFVLLEVTESNGTVHTVQYKGGSSVYHPTTVAEIAKGKVVSFYSTSGIVANKVLKAKRVKLQILYGDRQAGTTLVNATMILAMPVGEGYLYQCSTNGNYMYRLLFPTSTLPINDVVFTPSGFVSKNIGPLVIGSQTFNYVFDYPLTGNPSLTNYTVRFQNGTSEPNPLFAEWVYDVSQPPAINAGLDLTLPNCSFPQTVNLQAYKTGGLVGAGVKWSIVTGTGIIVNETGLNASYILSQADLNSAVVKLRIESTHEPCRIFDEVSIFPLAKPTLTVAGNTAICSGTATTLTASSTTANSSISWVGFAPYQPTITVSQLGSYTVTATTPQGCSASRTVQVTAAANCECTIPPNPSATSSDLPACAVPAGAVVLTGNIAGSYTFSATNYLVNNDLTFTGGTYSIPVGAVFYVVKKPIPTDPAANTKTSIVFNNANLTINGARFTACTDVWDGITFNGSATNALSVTNSVFANANNALSITNVASTYIVESNKFINNIDNCILLGLGTANANSRVTCNYFDSDRAKMLPPYNANGGYNTMAALKSKGGNYAAMVLRRNLSNNIIYGINNDESGDFVSSNNAWGALCNGVRDLSPSSGTLVSTNDKYVVKSEKIVTAQIKDEAGGGYANAGIQFAAVTATVRNCLFTNDFEGYGAGNNHNSAKTKAATGRLRDMIGVNFFGGTVNFDNNKIEGLDSGIDDYSGANFMGTLPVKITASQNSLRYNTLSYSKMQGPRNTYLAGDFMLLSCNRFEYTTTAILINDGTGLVDQGSGTAAAGNVFGAGCTNQIVDLNAGATNAWTYFYNGLIPSKGGSGQLTVSLTSAPAPLCTVPVARLSNVEEGLGLQVEISPNPFLSDVVLDLIATNTQEDCGYRVVNALGETVCSGTLKPEKQTIALGFLTKGLYSLVLTSRNGQMVVKKIIKE